MSLFNTILSKLGFNTEAEVAVAVAASPNLPDVAPVTTEMSLGAGQAAAAEALKAVSTVDVSAKLAALAANRGEKLNWQQSIVDLLKLLDLDSSLAARKALAAELECPAEKMDDSAQMNMWLHKAVMQKLAAHGGSVPPELLN